MLVSTILILLLSTMTGILGDDSMYFSRDAKWTNLAPSGGSLVSGRGNYRPGFARQGPYDPRMYLSEPFFAFKRSHRLLPQLRAAGESGSTTDLLHD